MEDVDDDTLRRYTRFELDFLDSIDLAMIIYATVQHRNRLAKHLDAYLTELTDPERRAVLEHHDFLRWQYDIMLKVNDALRRHPAS